MKLHTLVNYLDRELKLNHFSGDVSNNGLQVEANSECHKLLFTVDASMATFEAAHAKQCDFIFVHHGLSWGSNPRRLTSIDARRFGYLFNHQISLYAAHLPLDAAPDFGNNAQLAQIIGVGNLQPFFHYDGVDIGFIGTPEKPLALPEIQTRLQHAIGTPGQIFGPVKKSYSQVAICSGGGGLGSLLEAAEANCDLLLTGEFDHTMFHPAQELGLTVIAAGHYATETTGPRALMHKVAQELQLPVEFADIPTGL